MKEDVSTVGAYQINVKNPAAGTSNAVILQVKADTPSLISRSSQVDFQPVQVGSLSQPQKVILENQSTVAAVLESISTVGQFTQSNDCPASLPGGHTCTVNVVFAPTVSGTHNGGLYVYGDVDLVVQLYGPAGDAGSHLTPNPSAIIFTPVTVGQTSEERYLFLTNTGMNTLTIARPSVSSGEFAPLSYCDSLNVGQSCLVSLTFTPASIGDRSGRLRLTSEAGTTDIALQASGASVSSGPGTYTMGVADGASSTLTVTAGRAALTQIAVDDAGGYVGSVSLSCSGAPPGASCSIAPAVVDLLGKGGITTASVQVTTSARSSASTGPSTLPSNGTSPWTLSTVLLSGLVGFVFRRKSKVGATLACLVMSGVLLSSCGSGGKSDSTPQQSMGTPSGTYTLTITASGGTNQMTKLKLVVN